MSDLIEIQKEHLLLWKLRLRESLYAEIEGYVLSTNTENRVYRGQDLVQIIMDWPNLKDCYPSVKQEDVI